MGKADERDPDSAVVALASDLDRSVRQNQGILKLSSAKGALNVFLRASECDCGREVPDANIVHYECDNFAWNDWYVYNDGRMEELFYGRSPSWRSALV